MAQAAGEPGSEADARNDSSDYSDGSASYHRYYGDSSYYGRTKASDNYYGSSTYPGANYYGALTYASGGDDAILWRRALRFVGLGLTLAVSWPGILRLYANRADLTGWFLIVGAVFLGIVAAFVLGPFAASKAYDKYRRLELKELEDASAKAEASRPELSDLERAELERRQEIMDARLREDASYHRSDTQARSAYKIVQFSAAIGLALLVVAFAVAVTTTQSSLQIAAASLGAIGSATAAYVGATSLAVWERALSQLNWHDVQPLVNRQLIAAHKIAERLDAGERRDTALERVLTARLGLAADAFNSVAERSLNRRFRLLPRRGLASPPTAEPPKAQRTSPEQ